MLKKILRWIGLGIVALVMLLLAAFSVLTVYFSNLPWLALRAAAAVVAGGSLLFFGWKAFRKKPWKARGAFLGIFVGAWIWWLAIPARLDRDWKEEVRIQATAEFNGDTLTVRNVRNFKYESKSRFEPIREERTYDLSQIKGVDFAVSNWGMKRIAHTLLSFGFEDDSWLTISVETRLEKGEKYDALKGAFKQFELIYVLADERDLLGVRTNHRDESVFLYPTNATPAQARQLLVSILKGANRVSTEPEFYRSLGRNCTTTLAKHINEAIDPDIPFSTQLFFNGYIAELAYDIGYLPRDLPLEQLTKACDITAKARQIGDASDFSVQIRRKRDEAIAAAKAGG